MSPMRRSVKLQLKIDGKMSPSPRVTGANRYCIYHPWDGLQASVRSENDTADLRVIDGATRERQTNTQGSVGSLETLAATDAVASY